MELRKRKHVHYSDNVPRDDISEVPTPPPKVTLSRDDLIDDHMQCFAYQYPYREPSHDYKKYGHACGNVERAMEEILTRFTKKRATLATRMTGVTSCVEIAEMVTCALEKMGSRDIKWFGKNRLIEDTIIEIVESFTASEKRLAWETLGAQIEEVNDSAKELGILEDLPIVIKVLQEGKRKKVLKGRKRKL